MGIMSLTVTNSLSVELRVFNFCLVELLIGKQLKQLGSGSKLKELGSGSKLKELGFGCKLKQLGSSLGYDFPYYPHLIILQFNVEIKEKADFTATEYFEVARTVFGCTCWNDTHVGLLGQEVTDEYSFSQQQQRWRWR